MISSMLELDTNHERNSRLVQHERAVPSPAPPRDVAFVSIFSFGIDPQRGKVYGTDNIEHVDMWKRSVERLGINGTILHDKVFTPSFVERTKSGSVQYVRMDPYKQGLYSDPHLMKLTPADWRFISFHDYLKQHRDELGYVLLTDGHDVEFRTDPIAYMKAVDQVLGHKYVFGQEEWRPWVDMKATHPKNEGPLTAFSRLIPYWKNCFGTEMPETYDSGRLPNCGILGGHIDVVMPFLEKMRMWYSKVPMSNRFFMCDMLVYMRTIMEDYQDRFVSGYPFHARFKNNDPRDVAAIYHKHGLPGADYPERMAPGWYREELRKEPKAKTEDLPFEDGPEYVGGIEHMGGWDK